MAGNNIPKHFCILPWVHLYVDTWGRAKACCISRIQYGNVNNDDMKAIWNGKSIQSIRQQMLSDTPDQRCAICYQTEAQGHPSLRQENNEKFAKEVDNVLHSKNVDGLYESPIYWDIRFSNYCNFKCITCWHGASSKWYTAAKKKGQEAGKQAVLKAFDNDTPFFDYLTDHINNIEHVFIAGGEPLIMPENKKLLALLSSASNQPEVTINTNLSILPAIEQLQQWNKKLKLNFQLSFDGIGTEGEKIRDGLREEFFYKNLNLLQNVLLPEQITIHFTLSKFNIHLLLPTIKKMQELGVSQYQFKVNILERPHHMHYKHASTPIQTDQLSELSPHLQTLIQQINKNTNSSI